MKKIWLLTTLSLCGILLTGCNKHIENPEIIGNNRETEIKDYEDIISISSHDDNNTYTWKYLALYPFWTEIMPHEPDYSRMTVQKLYNDSNIKYDKANHCWKDIYFLNSAYDKITWNNRQDITSERIVIQEGPTKEPLYFDWELYQKVWTEEYISLDHLEWNILLTWYLENHLESECFTCNEEEQKDFWKVEVWRIHTEDWQQYGGFVLWYTEWEHIIAIYPNIRFDDIECFNSYNKCTDYHECVNLRDIANDWKVHTFRVVLDDWGSQERAYFGSMIREWDFIN